MGRDGFSASEQNSAHGSESYSQAMYTLVLPALLSHEVTE